MLKFLRMADKKLLSCFGSGVLRCIVQATFKDSYG